MSSQNISSFGHHFRTLATLSSNHITDVIQLAALCTSDKASLAQLSKDWGREERRDREDNGTLAHTIAGEYNYHRLGVQPLSSYILVAS